MEVGLIPVLSLTGQEGCWMKEKKETCHHPLQLLPPRCYCTKLGSFAFMLFCGGRKKEGMDGHKEGQARVVE